MPCDARPSVSLSSTVLLLLRGLPGVPLTRLEQVVMQGVVDLSLTASDGGVVASGTRILQLTGDSVLLARDGGRTALGVAAATRAELAAGFSGAMYVMPVRLASCGNNAARNVCCHNHQHLQNNDTAIQQ